MLSGVEQYYITTISLRLLNKQGPRASCILAFEETKLAQPNHSLSQQKYQRPHYYGQATRPYSRHLYQSSVFLHTSIQICIGACRSSTSRWASQIKYRIRR